MRTRSDRTNQYLTTEYREILARIAANVRRLRDATGWTQEECAFQCGEMPPRLYQMVESGRTNVTAITLSRLCRGFHVDVVSLLAPASPLSPRRPGRPRRSAK